MGKHRRRFLTLAGTLAGGSFFVGRKVYDDLVLAKREEDTSPAKSPFPEGTQSRDIFIDAIDGIRLHGCFIPAGEEDVRGRHCALMLHDTGASLAQTYEYAYHYREQGMDVLLADLRGHGKSGGNYYGYGRDDRLDVLTWTHWILKRDEQAKIMIHGLGCGAAAALMALPEHIPPAVYAVVSDSSYTTLSAYLLRLLQYGQATRLPARLRRLLLRFTIKIRAGYDIKDADVMAAVARAGTPVMFVHGDADRKVPVEMCRQLYARAQCTRQISIHLGAGHLESLQKDAVRYWEGIDTFLEKHSPDRL